MSLIHSAYEGVFSPWAWTRWLGLLCSGGHWGDYLQECSETVVRRAPRQLFIAPAQAWQRPLWLCAPDNDAAHRLWILTTAWFNGQRYRLNNSCVPYSPGNKAKRRVEQKSDSSIQRYCQNKQRNRQNFFFSNSDTNSSRSKRTKQSFGFGFLFQLGWGVFFTWRNACICGLKGIVSTTILLIYC